MITKVLTGSSPPEGHVMLALLAFEAAAVTTAPLCHLRRLITLASQKRATAIGGIGRARINNTDGNAKEKEDTVSEASGVNKN